MERKTYKVAGHIFSVTSESLAYELSVLLPSYTPFEIQESEEQPLFSFEITDKTYQQEEYDDEIGQFDCGGCNHGVYLMKDGGYLFDISDCTGKECCQVRTNKDFSHAVTYLLPGTPNEHAFGANNGLMIVYAFAAAPLNTVLIHASVIRNQEKGYLFLGKSGTGKSTHTRLWLKYIPGSDLMNDDNPVVRQLNGETRVYGSPWSGKTPCYRNIEAPVGAFVKLEQKKKNEMEREDVLHSFADLLSSVSVMKWDKKVYSDICNTISNILTTTPVYHLGCLPDEEAAQLSYQTVTGSR